MREVVPGAGLYEIRATGVRIAPGSERGLLERLGLRRVFLSGTFIRDGT